MVRVRGSGGGDARGLRERWRRGGRRGLGGGLVRLGFGAGLGRDGRGDGGGGLERRNASGSFKSELGGRSCFWGRRLTTSVSADMANWVRARRYNSGV